jgi:5-methylcytosine-specific restriction endonuclease McrA
VKPCNYCGDELTNYKKNKDSYGEFKYNGIDRIDSSKGYEIDNVVPCCKNCNTMKWDLDVDDFYKHIKKIIKYYEDKS